MSRVWKQRLDDRIGELQRLSESLDQCIGCGCLSLRHCVLHNPGDLCAQNGPGPRRWLGDPPPVAMGGPRSEEHTSELQSQSNLVCRLLLEKKKKNNNPTDVTSTQRT